ncbi:MAG: hypothetical protein WDZ49_06305 [Litorilinea sp.]
MPSSPQPTATPPSGLLSANPPGAAPIVLDSHALIPPTLLQNHAPQDFHIYNPTLARVGARLLMAYRMDWGRYPHLQRQIGICELDTNLRIRPESVQHFSQSICAGGERHYDPRFFQLGARLFLHYNNSYVTRPNQLHMVEVDTDTLRAKAPARPIVMDAPRQEIEKNWMFFEQAGAAWAVYRIQPHTILRVDLQGTGPIVCEVESTTTWDAGEYAARFGPLCGGASPVRHNDTYLAVFHSPRQLRPLHRWARNWPYAWADGLPRYPKAILRRLYPLLMDKRRYYGGIYAFDAQPPFRPRWISPQPILWPETAAPQRQPPVNRLAERVVYPCGALPWDDRRILIAYGVHDERCALHILDLGTVPKVSVEG